MSTRETWGSSLASIGGYMVVADLLDTPNHWIIGLLWLLIGAVLFIWPESK